MNYIRERASAIEFSIATGCMANLKMKIIRKKRAHSCWRAESLTSGRLASSGIVSSRMPSIGMMVEGPRTLSGLNCLVE